MKKAIKISCVTLAVVWLLVSYLLFYIVIDRQKHFEAFATAHIELIEHELSITNINVSRLEQELQTIQEKQAEPLDELGIMAPSRCGEGNKEELDNEHRNAKSFEDDRFRIR